MISNVFSLLCFLILLIFILVTFIIEVNVYYRKYRGTWVAQLVKHPTLGFSSGHDLMVCEFKPLNGLCIDSVESA